MANSDGIAIESTDGAISSKQSLLGLGDGALVKAMITRQIVPALTTDEMREVDRLMAEAYGIALLQMMENAGRNLAALARLILEGDVTDRPIVVLAGRGNNGGGGMVAARHLHNWGAWVQVVCTHVPELYGGVPAQQLIILQAMNVPLSWAEEGWELPTSDLVIDALIGYGLIGNPQGKTAEMIRLANSTQAQVLSLDAPSGLDTTTGTLFEPHIRADATMTLALPKKGLLGEQAMAVCGELHLADISVPPALLERLGIEMASPFSQDSIVRLIVEDGCASIRD